MTIVKTNPTLNIMMMAFSLNIISTTHFSMMSIVLKGSLLLITKPISNELNYRLEGITETRCRNKTNNERGEIKLFGFEGKLGNHHPSDE